MTLSAIGLSILGVATFFGAWKAVGTIIGKKLGDKKKSEIERLTALIHDPALKAQAIDAIKKADEYFTGEQGKSKLDWVVGRVALLIPGPVDDVIIRDILQGVYDAYKAEVNS